MVLRQGEKEAALLEEPGVDVEIIKINKVYILIISEAVSKVGWVCLIYYM